MKLEKIPFITFLDQLRTDFDIFFYSDKKGMPIQPQSHPYYEMYFLISGDVAYYTDYGLAMLRAGDVVFMRCHETHCPIVLDPSVPYERIILNIAPSTLERLSKGDTDLRSCFSENNCRVLRFPTVVGNSLRLVLHNLLKLKQQRPYGCALLADAYLIEFLVMVMQYTHTRQGEEDVQPPEPYQIFAIVDQFIAERLDRHISIDDLAKLVCMSKYHFMRVFRRVTGKSVYQHITEKRLELAESLVARGETYTAAAWQSGFGDYSCFYRAFFKKRGVSPREYFKRGLREDGA